jgi:hypothetical protein
MQRKGIRKRRNNRRASRGKGDSLARSSYLKQTARAQLTTLTFPWKMTKLSLAASSTFSLAVDVSNYTTILDTEAAAIVSRFNEWRIVKAVAELIPLSSTAGASVFWFAEDPASQVPSAQFKAATTRKFPNTNAQPTRCMLSWTPSDFTSLEFFTTSTSTTQPIFNFYGYTNSTDLGTPSSTTDLWTLTGNVTIECRGLGTQ